MTNNNEKYAIEALQKLQNHAKKTKNLENNVSKALLELMNRPGGPRNVKFRKRKISNTNNPHRNIPKSSLKKKENTFVYEI